MYLKSIIMQGFKSFAHKIDLEFHDGITGIVGPNGSGKSNVADAVRWVLGEQSARQLRGGSMQDVIFSGTEARKPLGFAMVSITFDNSDHALKIESEEVTVTRRLYRSGESAYEMNGRACRLKDINELFFDTGIGKEGYSIIGQGQIDRILSGKPEERRELFDEAAGIVKFKRRKAASLKKLDSEEQNLVRVTDLLNELTRQRGPLEEQAKKAEQYLKLRDEARLVDIDLFCLDSERIKKQIAEGKEKLSIAEAHQAELNESFEQTRQEYGEIEQKLVLLEEKITSGRERKTEDQLKKQQKEGQISILMEQIHASERNHALLQERADSIDEELKRRRNLREEDIKSRSLLSEKLELTAHKRDEKEAELAAIHGKIADLNAETEESRSRTISLLNRRSTIRENLQRYDTMLEHARIRQSEIDAELLQTRTESSEHEVLLASCAETERKLTEKISRQEKKAEEAAREIERLKRVLDDQNHKMEIGQTTFHRESSRLESLRNLAERYEGYGNSVKRIMEQRTDNPGIHGVIAELIKTRKKYETAIEIALGGSLQNIVTDNENTAKYLIEYLKRGHYGRATFLPLTSVRGGKPFSQDEVLEEDGVIGLASDLAECDRIYRDVVQSLLGRTVIVENADCAIRLGRKYRHTLRMVTLEGELFHAGGAMTGGAFRSSSNLLGRRREIEDLEKSVRMLQGELAGMQEEIEKTRRRRQEQRDLEHETGEKLQRLYLEQNTAHLNLEAAREKHADYEEKLLKLAQERAELDTQIGEINENRKTYTEELSRSESEENRLTSSVTASTEALNALQEEEETARNAHSHVLLEYSGMEQKDSFLKEKIRETEGEIERLSRERDAVAGGMRNETAQTEEKKDQIGSLEEEIRLLEEEISETTRETEQYLAEKDEMNRSHSTFFEKRDALMQERTEMEKEIFRLNAGMERQNEAYDQLTSYLYEAYEITPDQAHRLKSEETPPAGTLKKRQAELKKEMKQLGDVNVGAIDEFRDLRERHDFLSAQHADLVAAADALRDIIKKLDQSMRRQFMEKFALIQEEYNRVFKELFGGGKGTLSLVEDEDILDAGILINSQPPGKKLQNMMQLSGGEKALSAIALLFAIQNLKPSPFCLLDEIEAALDDSNVGRFAEYLDKLTKNTQFIIITHRRGTMAAADRLYGITMQEKGVSALVSVSLIENELDQ